MADIVIQVVVSPLLQAVVDNLNSLIQNELGLVRGLPQKLQKLSSTLSTIQSVLEDAEEKQLTNKAIGNWLGKLKDAAYDAEDLLDDCSSQGLLPVPEMGSNSSTSQVTDSFLSCLDLKQIILRREVGKRIKQLNNRFDEIAEERSKFHLTAGTVERRRFIESFPDRETGSMLTELPVYGREQDKENLVSSLVNNLNREGNISICPVVGIGGLGKTTLAQLVYNDEKVIEHFEIKHWACVSDDYDLKRFLKSVITTISGTQCDLEELVHLQSRLEEKLGGKRFLLVLDDVWIENQEEWNRLISSFRHGAKGSTVVVTTRLETVAAITGTVPAYHLTVLSEDDCWSLFKQRAFGTGNDERQDLVKIGREIVKKCGGLPLAAKALGGLMRFKHEECEWLSVKDSEVWDLPQGNENNILPALKLSYNHLPSHLKQCFAFCSIYPKDHNIRKVELLNLWIANGLVQSKARMELEDVGNEIFNDLLWRSFFQDIKKDGDGNIIYCKMHDLLHDLAHSITLNECSSVGIDRIGRKEERARHLILNLHSRFSSLTKLPPLLRTLLLRRGDGMYQASQLDFSDLKFLRFLDVGNCGIDELPIPTSRLKHLRYLNLTSTRITALPESICSLRYLQVLDLRYCDRLKMLPKHMSKMSSLKHLFISGCDQLTHMPHGISHLVHLQTLSTFIVGPKRGHRIKELQQLDLRGGLCIKGLEHVSNIEEAREAKLITKKNLHSLKFAWSDLSLQEEHSEEVLEGLQPHPNTEILSIQGYAGVNFPSWFSTLPKLVYINLIKCTGIANLTSLSHLPSLKGLHIEGMCSLVSIGSELYCLSSLQNLTLSNMPELEEWSSLVENGREMSILPYLKRLTISECPKVEKLLVAVHLINWTGIANMTPLRQLPSLEVLNIRGMSSLVSVGSELYSLSSLQNLTLSNMPELEEWSSSVENGRDMSILPHLKSLTISECPKLEKLWFPSSVEFLDMSNCNQNLLRLLQNLPCLSSLSICKFHELISFPEGMLGNLSALKSLEIQYCIKLQSLPTELENLTALTSLEIYECKELSSIPETLQNLTSVSISGCHGLESLPFLETCSLHNLQIQNCKSLTSLSEGLQHQTTLQVLAIDGCDKLEFLPRDFHQLRSLTRLELWSLPKLSSLPEGLQHASTLQNLEISSCSGLKVLPDWLGSLISLKYLDIRFCINLESLPEEMQGLTDLRHLRIERCSDELERRCKKDIGADWYKISHIPELIIESLTQIKKRRQRQSSRSGLLPWKRLFVHEIF